MCVGSANEELQEGISEQLETESRKRRQSVTLLELSQGRTHVERMQPQERHFLSHLWRTRYHRIPLSRKSQFEASRFIARGVKKRVRSGISGNKSPETSVDEVPTRAFKLFNHIYDINTCFRRCPHLRVKIFDEEIEGLADTGAGVTIMNSASLINKLGLKLQKCNIRIKTADNTEYTCLGYVNIPYTYGTRTCVVPTIVVPEVTKPLILGVDFLNTFDFKLMVPESTNSHNTPNQQISEDDQVPLMVAEDFFSDDEQTICFQIEPIEPEVADEPKETDDSLEMPTLEIPTSKVQTPTDIDTEHQLTDDQRQMLFEAVTMLPATAEGSLGRTTILKHSIELLPGSQPRRLPMYKWSPIVEKVIDEEVERMRKLGVTEECSGPV